MKTLNEANEQNHVSKGNFDGAFKGNGYVKALLHNQDGATGNLAGDEGAQVNTGFTQQS